MCAALAVFFQTIGVSNSTWRVKLKFKSESVENSIHFIDCQSCSASSFLKLNVFLIINTTPIGDRTPLVSFQASLQSPSWIDQLTISISITSSTSIYFGTPWYVEHLHCNWWICYTVGEYIAYEHCNYQSLIIDYQHQYHHPPSSSVIGVASKEGKREEKKGCLAVELLHKQARKAPSYASSKLWLTDLLTDGGQV